MTNLNLNLSDDQLTALLGTAILDALTPQMRATMIESALKHLVAPNTSGYGSKLSPLQQAFQGAVASVARKLSEEIIENDPAVMAHIKELVVAAWEKVMSGHQRDTLVNRIAVGITTGLTSN